MENRRNVRLKVDESAGPSSKQSTSVTECVDRISSLPLRLVVNEIFYKLPQKEWVVASAVSKKWKYLISDISRVEFMEWMFYKNMDRILCSYSGELPYWLHRGQLVKQRRQQFMDYVDRTLLLHSGKTMDTFCLSFRYYRDDIYMSRIDRWVKYAMMGNVKAMALDFSGGMDGRFLDNLRNPLTNLEGLAEPYELRCHPYRPNLLELLKLNFCKFKPSSFKMFSVLKQLVLQQVVVLDESIGITISNCPMLKHLHLIMCCIPDKYFVYEGELQLESLFIHWCITNAQFEVEGNICAPKLLLLQISGKTFRSFTVRKALVLVDAAINIYPSSPDEQGDTVRLLLRNLQHAKTLTLSNWMIQVLPRRMNTHKELQCLENLHTPFRFLKTLKLDLKWVMQEPQGLACLLRSCPNVERLYLTIKTDGIQEWDFQIPDTMNFDDEDFWESQTLPFNCLLHSLKKVQIHGFVGAKREVLFVQFLLENCKVLEKMDIKSNQINWGRQSAIYLYFHHQYSNILLNIPRASPKARVELS